jgi:hypothetical protein
MHAIQRPLQRIFEGFGGNISVFDNSTNFLNYIYSENWNDAVLLLMSSGNFDGIDYELLGEEIIQKLV